MSEFIITSDQLERLIEGIEHDTGREINRVVERGTELPEVVRCSDCESATDHCEGMDVYWCEYLSRYVGADTFCAWASRKESE